MSENSTEIFLIKNTMLINTLAKISTFWCSVSQNVLINHPTNSLVYLCKMRYLALCLDPPAKMHDLAFALLHTLSEDMSNEKK